MKAYYERRAGEYDDVWYRAGRFAERPNRTLWHEQVVRLLGTLASLPAARTLDVACGTGFLTRHLHGEVTGLDQSPSMLERARRQAPNATFVQGDAFALPFEPASFDRVFTSFFYGHLEPADCERFLAEARRVGRELVVAESTPAADRPAEAWEERELDDGSRWRVFKRYFEGDDLAAELGGTVLLDGPRFVVVQA